MKNYLIVVNEKEYMFIHIYFTPNGNLIKEYIPNNKPKLKETMSFYTQLVTPDMARVLLVKNKVNRKPSEVNVNFLAKQMLEGNFKKTGQTIQISKSGNLLDGQHRLLAIIKSNITVELNFCDGLDDEIFDVIDTGKSRTTADIFSVQGYKNPGELSSAITNLLQIKAGSRNVQKVSNSKNLDFVKDNPELPEIVNLCHKENRKFKSLSTGAIAAIYYTFSKLHHEDAETFFDKYYSGVGMENSDVVLMLRNKLMQDAVNKRKYTSEQKVALVIAAWNIMRKGKVVKRLDLPESGIPKPL